jgi:hypothetical protein
MAKLVAAGVTLRDQLNARFPKRDKRSDGWIGDYAHSTRASLHNPDKDGWVHALDIDEDFGAPGSAEKFCDQLLAYVRAGLDHHRILHVVYDGRVASGTFPNRPGRPETFWVWRQDATLGHKQHIHISFTDRAEKDGRPFNLPIFDTAPPLTPAKKAPAKKVPKKKTPTA